MILREEREMVIEYGRYLYEAHLVGFADGNISAREKKSNYIAIKPSGIPWPKIQMNDVIIIDLAGNIIDGKLKPSSEVAMHTIMYRNRDDVNGVVHCHPPVATAFGVVNRSIPSLIVNQGLTNGEIHVAPYDCPGSNELGENAYKILGKEGQAVILQNHGILTLGESLEGALHAAFSVEDAAKVALSCHTLGGEFREVTLADYRKMDEIYLAAK